jgi:hypothetical protein
MKTEQKLTYRDNWPKLANFPISAKVLATSVILIMGIAKSSESGKEERLTGGRGDLFKEFPSKEKANVKEPFYKTQQFVWLLKWTHIHLFGMNMIFIFMGAIAIFLNMSDGWRSCLVILPFVGVLVDISAMWLRAYVSPSFFWLHLPGAGLFGLVFVIVAFRAIVEMWRSNL